MRLSRTDRVAELSASDARAVMRHFHEPQPERMISSWIDTGSRTGSEVARALADAGYLTTYNVDQNGRTWWESTV